MRTLQLIKKKKLVLLLAAILALLGLSALFIPFFFITSYADSQLDNVIEDSTFTKKKNLLAPEVIVFTEEQDGDVTANFVKLQRKYLVWWETKSITKQEKENTNGEKSTEEVVKGMTDEIKSGDLSSGDNVDVDEVSEYDQQIKELNTQDNETLATYTNEDGDQVLELKSTINGGTYLALNGSALPINGNVSSPAISTTGDRVCYSKYTSSNGDEGADGMSEYSGIVYCMDTKTKHEEEMYSFGKGTLLSLGVNGKYVIYSLSSGEIGVIELTAKAKTKILALDMLSGSSPSSVIFVDEQSAVIDPNDYEKLVNKNERMINLDLTNMSHSEQ